MIKSFLLFLFSSAVIAQNVNPRMVIHVLDYVAMDYRIAVKDGKVVDKDEYDEQSKLVGAAQETVKQVELGDSRESIEAGLQELLVAIDAKKPAREISERCRAIEKAYLGATRLSLAPRTWPNRLAGKKVFETNCTQCHGVKGDGNGPLAATLDPKPSNFLAPEMAERSPVQLYHAVKLGVPGTPMAAFSNLSDEETWAVAFFLSGLRHEPRDPPGPGSSGPFSLEELATKSDEDLQLKYASLEDVQSQIARERLRIPSADAALDSFKKAKELFRQAGADYQAGKAADAKQKVITAYLEGIEPVEPSLRTKDPVLLRSIEASVNTLRGRIESADTPENIRAGIDQVLAKMGEVETSLADADSSPAFTFTVAAGVMLREGFEVVLILVSLLSVLRALGASSAPAVRFVHGGWILAMAAGVVLWFFSGWVVQISGAQRENLEGIFTLIAVGILLYFGFWLHRGVEISKWRSYLDTTLKGALQRKRLWLIGIASFIAVFREAIEVVLFLRVLLLKSGPAQSASLLGGVMFALVLVTLLSVLLLRFSVRLPIKQVFSFSSMLMVLLAVIMTGKAIHAFQESGVLSVTMLPVGLHIDILGLYPTWESILPQLFLAILITIIWVGSSRWRGSDLAKS